MQAAYEQPPVLSPESPFTMTHGHTGTCMRLKSAHCMYKIVVYLQ